MSRLDGRKNDLSPRAPPFAADLNAVIEFYDTRFGIELTAREKSDLVTFRGRRL